MPQVRQEFLGANLDPTMPGLLKGQMQPDEWNRFVMEVNRAIYNVQQTMGYSPLATLLMFCIAITLIIMDVGLNLFGGIATTIAILTTFIVLGGCVICYLGAFRQSRDCNAKVHDVCQAYSDAEKNLLFFYRSGPTAAGGDAAAMSSLGQNRFYIEIFVGDIGAGAGRAGMGLAGGSGTQDESDGEEEEESDEEEEDTDEEEESDEDDEEDGDEQDEDDSDKKEEEGEGESDGEEDRNEKSKSKNESFVSEASEQVTSDSEDDDHAGSSAQQRRLLGSKPSASESSHSRTEEASCPTLDATPIGAAGSASGNTSSGVLQVVPEVDPKDIPFGSAHSRTTDSTHSRAHPQQPTASALSSSDQFNDSDVVELGMSRVIPQTSSSARGDPFNDSDVVELGMSRVIPVSQHSQYNDSLAMATEIVPMDDVTEEGESESSSDSDDSGSGREMVPDDEDVDLHPTVSDRLAGR